MNLTRIEDDLVKAENENILHNSSGLYYKIYTMKGKVPKNDMVDR